MLSNEREKSLEIIFEYNSELDENSEQSDLTCWVELFLGTQQKIERVLEKELHDECGSEIWMTKDKHKNAVPILQHDKTERLSDVVDQNVDSVFLAVFMKQLLIKVLRREHLPREESATVAAVLKMADWDEDVALKRVSNTRSIYKTIFEKTILIPLTQETSSIWLRKRISKGKLS